jgi:hypothetical protein
VRTSAITSGEEEAMTDKQEQAEQSGASGGSLAKGWLSETLERVSAEVSAWSPDKRRLMAEMLPEPHRTEEIMRLSEMGKKTPNMGRELGSK